MITTRNFYKILKYTGSEDCAEIKICTMATKKMMRQINSDLHPAIMDSFVVFEGGVSEVKFSSDMKKTEMEMGVFANTLEQHSNIVSDVEMSKKVILKMDVISENNDKKCGVAPVVIMKVKSSSKKFIDYFPKRAGEYCYLEFAIPQEDLELKDDNILDAS